MTRRQAYMKEYNKKCYQDPEIRERKLTATKKWRARNPGYGKNWRSTNWDYTRRWWLQRHYGITIEEYDALLERQGGVCALCGAKPNGRRLHVDHCHNSKKIRGLLCEMCNKGLGQFKDDVVILQKAVRYLLGRKP